MLTEPILSHESEYPFPVVPTVLKLAGQGTSDSADSRGRLVLYEPAHSGSITHLVDTIDRHHIGTESCPEISIQQQNGYHHRTEANHVLNRRRRQEADKEEEEKEKVEAEEDKEMEELEEDENYEGVEEGRGGESRVRGERGGRRRRRRGRGR
ncbi:hypothetical protein M8J77_004418 [Diaphorina citri]|nr:hypothetical protein M8J77_004418 [Diaphorina citri]